MNFEIKIDLDERRLRKAIEQAATEAVNETASAAQTAFDRVQRTHSEKPVAEVLAALRNETRRLDWNVDDNFLLPYAEAIAEGTRVEVRIGDLHW